MHYFIQGIHISLFFLFSFSFCHSIITIWHHFHHIITEHGALLTGHGSWMALSVMSGSSATPPDIPIPEVCNFPAQGTRVRPCDWLYCSSRRNAAREPRWMDSYHPPDIGRVVRYYLPTFHDLQKNMMKNLKTKCIRFSTGIYVPFAFA